MALLIPALLLLFWGPLTLGGAPPLRFSSPSFTPVTSFAPRSLAFPTTTFASTPLAAAAFAPALTTTSAQRLDSQSLAKITNLNDKPLLDTPSLEASKRLYDQSSFRNWNLVMSQQDIDTMNLNPTLEQKFPCTVTSNYGTPSAKTFSVPSLTCRYKGSVGSLRLCLDEYNRFNGKCRKLSWAVDIEGLKLPKTNVTKRDDEKSIHGAENLIFGGCPVDWSMMSERMSYNLLQSIGVTAPMATHAKLFLNGKYLGVYSFVQAADRTFAKERFLGDKNKGKGAIYKEVWFNQLGMLELGEERKGGSIEDDMYMRTIMAAIDASPLTQDAAVRLFETYFDTKSFIDITAFNTVIGATDDWRQRHNFLWYIRDGSTGKKLVLLPWDYDRLYDPQAKTRGALQGAPWWNIQATAQPSRCNAPLARPEQLAMEAATSASEIGRWTEIFRTLPADNKVPITCDKITKLLSLAFGAKVRARTLELLNIISIEQIRANFAVWNAQIETALAYDPDGPTAFKMRDEQNKLLTHMAEARNTAMTQANMGDFATPMAMPMGTPMAAGFRPMLGRRG